MINTDETELQYLKKLIILIYVCNYVYNEKWLYLAWKLSFVFEFFMSKLFVEQNMNV